MGSGIFGQFILFNHKLFAVEAPGDFEWSSGYSNVPSFPLSDFLTTFKICAAHY